jgi:hypothetical protein
MDQSTTYISNGIRNIVIVVTVIAVIGTIIDLISIWLKTMKPKDDKKTA